MIVQQTRSKIKGVFSGLERTEGIAHFCVWIVALHVRLEVDRSPKGAGSVGRGSNAALDLNAFGR